MALQLADSHMIWKSSEQREIKN